MEETKPKKKKTGCSTVLLATFVLFVIFYLIGSNEMATKSDSSSTSKSNEINKTEPIPEATTEAPIVYEYIEGLKLDELNVTERIEIIKDEVELYTLYKSKLSPKFVNITGLMIIFSEKDGIFSKPTIQFQYGGKDWVMFDEIIINADGSILTTIEVPFFDKKTEVISGGVYEVYNTSDEATIFNLIDVAKSAKATIRYKGETDMYDYEVSDNDRKSIKEIIDFYQLKTGIFFTDWE